MRAVAAERASKRAAEPFYPKACRERCGERVGGCDLGTGSLA